MSMVGQVWLGASRPTCSSMQTTKAMCTTMRLLRTPINVAHTKLGLRSRCLPQSHRIVSRTALSSKSSSGGEGEDDYVSEAFEPEFDDAEADDGRGLSTEQVTALMEMVCNETDVAEIELEMGSFQLHVRRRVDAKAGSAAAPASNASQNPAVLGSTTNFDFPAEELDQFQKDHSQNGNSAGPSTEEDDEDESLVYVPSPKVGVLRRGKYFKGKKVGKGNAVNEGDKVKKGQIVAYIEQLGTFVPVEAPQAGEAVEFLIEEGKPVEFRQEVVTLAPFFGGHIIGDAKYS